MLLKILKLFSARKMSGGGIIPRGGGYSKRRGRGRRGGGNGGFRDDIRDNQSDRHLSPDRR